MLTELMPFVRPVPFSEWDNLFDSLSKQVFREHTPTKNFDWIPSVDISDQESSYLVSVELPGLTKDQVAIEVANGALRISGERKKEEKTYHTTERIYGKFLRTIRLPAGTNTESITAEMKDGVLQVVIPKVTSANVPKKLISIT